MANTAFDRHSEFCEKYIVEIHEMVRTFFREGETEQALTHAGKLYTLREEYATWLTEDINSNIDAFEGAIGKLGAETRSINTTEGGQQHAEQRSLRIDSSFELFNEMLGLDKESDINEDYAVEAIPKISINDEFLITELSRFKAIIEDYRRIRQSYFDLKEETNKTTFEGFLLIFSPILICIALALRFTKVTGEIKIEKANQANSCAKINPRPWNWEKSHEIGYCYPVGESCNGSSSI